MNNYYLHGQETIAFWHREPTRDQVLSRVGSRCKNVVSAVKDIIFFIFWKNGTPVSPVSCQIYRSFQGKNVKNGVRK